MTIDKLFSRCCVSAASLVWLAILVPAIQARGDNVPAIVTGYGETTWGQSLAEVQVIWSGGKVEAHRGAFTSYGVSAADDDGLIRKKILNFIDDQFESVVVVYDLPDRPERGEDTHGLALVKGFINKKYRPTPEAARQLQKENGIFIDARVRPDSTIYVSYVNRKIRGAAEQALARETFERREKEDTARTPKHKALGLEETL